MSRGEVEIVRRAHGGVNAGILTANIRCNTPLIRARERARSVFVPCCTICFTWSACHPDAPQPVSGGKELTAHATSSSDTSRTGVSEGRGGNGSPTTSGGCSSNTLARLVVLAAAKEAEVSACAARAGRIALQRRRTR